MSDRWIQIVQQLIIEKSDHINSWVLLLENIKHSKIPLDPTSYHDGNDWDTLSCQNSRITSVYFFQISLLQLASIIYLAFTVSQAYSVNTNI